MVDFRTLITLHRPYTGSWLVLDFRSLLSIEFMVFDLIGKLPGWQIESYGHYAQFEGKRYFWGGDGSPKEFIGDWRFMYDTVNDLAGDRL